jgi:hypothetical protein
MTAREIFETVREHLLTQGERSIERVKQNRGYINQCRYRTSDGLKCAIGCLIPDEVYREELEGRGLHDLIRHYKDLKFLLPSDIEEYEKGVRLLDRLQCIHDCVEPEAWDLELDSFEKFWFTEIIKENN